MKFKVTPNRSFLYHYLISFLIVLLIPIIALSFLMKTKIFNLLQEEISQNNLELLKNVAELFESDLDSMEEIVSQIMLTPCFYNKKTTSDVIQLDECQNLLSIYTTSGSSFQTIAVSWENLPYVYSGHGSCSFDLLDKSDPMYPVFTEDESFSITVAKKNPLIPNNRTYLLFTYPVEFPRPKQQAKIMFLAEAERYYGESRFSSITNDTYYYIFYGSQLISCNTDYIPFGSLNTESLLDFSEPFTQTFEIDGTEMLLCAIPSTHNNFYFLSLTPLKTAMSAANRLQQEFLLFVIISFMVALAVIMINLQLNYRPIHNLFSSVKHLLNNNQKHLNEVSSIQSAIDNLASKNERLLFDNLENMATTIFSDLLKGNYSVQKPISEEDLKAINFKPVYSHYIVCIMCFHEKHHKITTKTIMSIIRPFFDVFLIKEINEYTVPILINLEEEQVRKLDDFRQAISNYCNFPITLSAGNLYSNIYDCSQSYTEALYTMDYRFIKGNNCVIQASDVAFQEDWSEQYPKNDLLKLRRMLGNRNLSTSVQINEQLNYILNYIQTCDVPMFAARSICFEIINIILSSMNDEELKNNKSYLTHLSHYDTVEEMLASLSMICHNLFSFSETNDTCKIDLITQMKIYVDNNYTDSNFSLQEMADYFNMGMTNLSQYFKRQTGNTLIEYYTGLRMEKAKILLSDPQNKIDDIAVKIGYLNTSSFIRRFKQYYGISPRQFTQSLSEKE